MIDFLTIETEVRNILFYNCYVTNMVMIFLGIILFERMSKTFKSLIRSLGFRIR